MRSFCYFRTPNAEKGNIMATTNETMKVIAEGIDQKKSPDIIMDGRVIVIEIPEEMEEIFRGLAWSLVKECDKTYEKVLESEIDEKDEDWVDNETGELVYRNIYRRSPGKGGNHGNHADDQQRNDRIGTSVLFAAGSHHSALRMGILCGGNYRA